MNKHIFLVLLLVFTLKGNSINVEVSTFSFYGANPYTEVYFRVEGNSVNWSKNDGVKRASVDILYYVYRTDGSIAAYDKFELTSVVYDTIVDFLGVKRFKLSSGEYTIKIEVNESSIPTNKVEMEQKLLVDSPANKFLLSDILLLGEIKKDTSDNAMVKNEVYMEPLAYNFSSGSQQRLDFYIESYLQDTTAGSEYFLQYHIMEGFSSNVNTKPLLSKYKKIVVKPTEPALLYFPANSLRSGDYHILVNIIDKEKKSLASRKINFVKSNPVADIAHLENFNELLENSFVQQIKTEDLDYILKAHLPITDQHQVSTLGELIKSNKIKSQRQFLFQYWKSKASANPEGAYKAYMDVAKAVDKMFYSNVGFGFQSDRGFIFLKYGKPTNVVSIDTEPDAVPYEIWYYNYVSLSRQTNVRFLFYNPSLAHNDFKLLHSTCIGEKVNPAWETELYKSVPAERLGNTIDATQVGENWNRNARRYFNDF